MVKNARLTHPFKVAQSGRLVNVGEDLQVADILRAGFPFSQIGLGLVAGICHITSVFLAIYQKPIALENGTRTVPLGLGRFDPR